MGIYYRSNNQKIFVELKCDICGEQIKKVNLSAVAWIQRYAKDPVKGCIFVHNGECGKKADQKYPEGGLRWWETAYFLRSFEDIGLEREEHTEPMREIDL